MKGDVPSWEEGMVDGLLVTNEVMDEAEKRKNYLVVDVDFEKSCDFVC